MKNSKTWEVTEAFALSRMVNVLYGCGAELQEKNRPAWNIAMIDRKLTKAKA